MNAVTLGAVIRGCRAGRDQQQIGNITHCLVSEDGGYIKRQNYEKLFPIVSKRPGIIAAILREK